MLLGTAVITLLGPQIIPLLRAEVEDAVSLQQELHSVIKRAVRKLADALSLEIELYSLAAYTYDKEVHFAMKIGSGTYKEDAFYLAKLKGNRLVVEQNPQQVIEEEEDI